MLPWWNKFHTGMVIQTRRRREKSHAWKRRRWIEYEIQVYRIKIHWTWAYVIRLFVHHKNQSAAARTEEHLFFQQQQTVARKFLQGNENLDDHHTYVDVRTVTDGTSWACGTGRHTAFKALASNNSCSGQPLYTVQTCPPCFQHLPEDPFFMAIQLCSGSQASRYASQIKQTPGRIMSSFASHSRPLHCMPCINPALNSGSPAPQDKSAFKKSRLDMTLTHLSKLLGKHIAYKMII
jgi:hypothetical protein